MTQQLFGGKVQGGMQQARLVLPRFLISGGLAVASISCALAQERILTLADAIAMARQRNGNVRAAFLDVEAAKSRTRESFAAFLPNLAGSAGYESTKSETFTGQFQGKSGTADPISQINANWRLLDSGEREWTYQSNRRFQEASAATALDTLRNTLFAVNRQYYEALRNEELLRVSDAQVTRAQEIEKQTQAQIDVGAAAKKDILQVRADRLNAEVIRLTAVNSTSVAEATLKALIGIDSNAKLDKLQAPAEPATFEQPAALETAVKEGFANRPDLIALRKRRDAQALAVRIADRRAGLTWTLDTRYDRSFSREVTDFASATFLASYPLFDGHRLREQWRQEKLALQSEEALLTQSERNARAEIESAHAVLRQDIERVTAAKAALEAAKLNYTAELESQRLGAEGTSVITVLTAQVSLVTAESNYIDALYDYFISDVRLKLVTGVQIPGENG